MTNPGESTNSYRETDLDASACEGKACKQFHEKLSAQLEIFGKWLGIVGDKGLNVRSCQEMVASANKLLEEGSYEEAIGIFFQARDWLRENSSGIPGFDTPRIMEQIDTLTKTEGSQEILEGLLEGAKMETEVCIDYTRRILSGLRQSKVNVSESEMFLKKSEMMETRGRYPESNEMTKRAMDTAFKSQQLRIEKLTEAAGTAGVRISDKKTFKAAENEVDSKTVYDFEGRCSRLKKLISSGYHDEAVVFGKKLIDDLLEAIKSLRNDANNTLDNVREYIVQLEGKDIDVGPAQNILSKAVEKAKGNLLLDCIDYANIAMNKARELERKHNELKDRKKDTEEAIEGLKKIGYDTAPFEDKFSEIELIEDSDEVLAALKALDRECSELYTSRFEELEKKINKAEKYFKNLSERGINVTVAMNTLEEARRELKQDNYQEAKAGLEQSIARADEMEVAGYKASKRLEEAKDAIEKTRTSGAYVDDLLERVRELEELQDYEGMIEEADKIVSLVQDTREKLKETAAAKVKAISDKLEEFKEDGIENGEAESLLESAARFLEEESFASAIKLASEAGERASAIKKTHDELLGEREDAGRIFNEIEVSGIDLADIRERMKDIESEKDYAKALDAIRALKKEARERRVGLRMNAMEILESAEKRLKTLEGRGVNVGMLASSLQNQREKLESDKFTTVLDELKHFSYECDRLEEQFEEKTKGRMEIEEQLLWLEEHKVEDLERFRTKQDDISEMEDYGKANEMINELRGALQDFKNELREDAEKKVFEAGKAMEALRSDGIASREAEESMDKAEECLFEEWFPWAIKNAKNAKILAENSRTKYGRTIEKIKELEDVLRYMKDKGLDIDEEIDRLMSIRNEENYDRAIMLIDDIKRDVTKKKRGLEIKTRVFIDETRNLLVEAESAGLNITAAMLLLESAEEKLRDEDFLDAISDVEKAKAEAGKSKTELERLQGEMARIRKALGELEELQLNVSDFSSRLSELEELKDYEKALDQVDLLFKDIRDFKDTKERDAKYSMERMTSMLAEMDAKGINTGEAGVFFDKAKVCMDKDYYDWAMGHITMAKKTAEKIQEDCTRFFEELEKLEGELEDSKTTGIEVGDLIDGLITLRERSDYEVATRSIEDIREKISERKDKLGEEVLSLLNIERESVRELRDSGAATNRLHDLEEKCNGLMEQGLLGDARSVIEELSQLVTRTREDYGIFQQSVNETNPIMARVEKAGVDTSGFIERFEEIKKDTDYGVGHSLLQTLGREMREEIEALHKENQLLMVETFEHIQALEEKGIRISEAKEIFDESVKLMQEERYTESKGKSNQAKVKADELRILDEEYNSLISRMENALNYAGLMGIQTEGLDENLQNLKSGFTTYTEALSRAKQIIVEFEKVDKEMKNECEKGIESTRKYLGGFKKKGVRTANAEAILGQAEGKVAAGEYMDVKGICDSARQKVNELQEQHANLTDFIADLVKSKERAEDMDIDCSDIPDQIGAIERLDDYEQAIKLTIELIDTVERQIEGELNKQYEAISQDIRNRLSKLEADVDRLSVTGIDVTGIREELKNARNALERRAFSEARKLANEAKTSYNQLSKELIDILKVEEEGTVGVEPLVAMKAGETQECPGCTTMISVDINFCPYCGFKLEQKRDVLDERMQTVQARLSALTGSGQGTTEIEKIMAEAMVGMEHGRFDIAELKLAEAEAAMDTLEGGTNLIKLPFTHGIETELQVVMNDGRWIMGSEMKKVFARIVEDSHERLEGIFRGHWDGEPEVLTYIREKVKGIEIKQDKAKNDAVHVSYEMPDGTVGEFPVIGKDSHVTFETNILEIQTPPCQYLKELEWWLYTVFRLSSEAIEEMGIGLNIVSTGLNPVEEYVKGVSFGDHHHIGVKDEHQRIAAYNMLRNFLPHFIALSANSPLENATDKVVDIKFNPKNSIISRLEPLSIRLEKNTGQLALVPELAQGEDVNIFMKKIDRVDQKSARMVDLYPFTRFGTIELRYFDTQLSVSDRISYAVMLQALALKATKMAAGGEPIPCITGENLKKLREKSLQGGLLSTFVVKDANLDANPDFAKYYQKERYDGNGKLLYMVDACTNMLYYISDELFDMKVVGSYYLDPVFIKLFGGKDSGHILGPPITSAQFQLYLFDMECNRDLQTLVNELGRESRKAAGSLAYNPLIEKLGNPIVPEFMTLKGLTMEIRVPSSIIAPLGGSVRESFGKFGIMLANEGKAPQKEIRLKYSVVDDKGGILEKKEVAVGTIPVGQDKIIQVKFPVRGDISSCSIECRAQTALESITKTGVISVQRIDIGIAWIGAGSYITTKETVSIPYTMEVLNELDTDVSSVIKITARDADSEEVLGSYEKDVTLKAKDKNLYGSMTGAIAEWAEETLRIQKYIELPPLEITPSDEKNIKCKLYAELDVDGQVFASESRRTFMVYKRM